MSLTAGTEVQIARVIFADWPYAGKGKNDDERSRDALVASAGSTALEFVKIPEPSTLFLYFTGASAQTLGDVVVAPARTIVECRWTADGQSELGSVVQATLAAPREWQGMKLPAGASVTFHSKADGGGVAVWNVIDEARTFNQIRAPKGSDVRFHPNGQVAFIGELTVRLPLRQEPLIIEAATTDYGTLKCARSVTIHPNGVLAHCSLAQDTPVRVGSVVCNGPNGIDWDDKGQLARCNPLAPPR